MQHLARVLFEPRPALSCELGARPPYSKLIRSCPGSGCGGGSSAPAVGHLPFEQLVVARRRCAHRLGDGPVQRHGGVLAPRPAPRPRPVRRARPACRARPSLHRSSGRRHRRRGASAAAAASCNGSPCGRSSSTSAAAWGSSPKPDGRGSSGNTGSSASRSSRAISVGIGAAPALELQVLADGVVEQSHDASNHTAQPGAGARPRARPSARRRLHLRDPRRRAGGRRGAIAQLGERLDRTQEVGGSSPPSSIARNPRVAGSGLFWRVVLSGCRGARGELRGNTGLTDHRLRVDVWLILELVDDVAVARQRGRASWPSWRAT